MKNSTVKKIRGEHGLEYLSVQVSKLYYKECLRTVHVCIKTCILYNI